MKLMGYYTTANTVSYKQENPRAAYINLSRVGDLVKTTVIIGSQVISIPRWLLLDHLSIEQILDPERRSVRRSKDRLTIQPELTKMMADRGFRWGRCMNAHIPKPHLSVKAVTELGYADTVRAELREKSISYVDAVKKIMVSFFEIRPSQASNQDAVAACMDEYGWDWFEFQAAWLMYHRPGNQWVAHNDPERAQSSGVMTPLID